MFHVTDEACVVLLLYGCIVLIHWFWFTVNMTVNMIGYLHSQSHRRQ
jgi:hypothetical protein